MTLQQNLPHLSFVKAIIRQHLDAPLGLQVSEAEEEEQIQVDNIRQQESQLAQAKNAAGLARWRRLQVSIHRLLPAAQGF